MKTFLSYKFALLIICLVFLTPAFADVKVKSRQTMSGQTSESTTYIKGKRQRAEQNAGGMQTVSITQCDLKRSLQLMPQGQVYMVNNWDQDSTAPTTTTVAGSVQTEVKKGGVITTTITTKDTGERKQMFGYTAKHLIITTETESSPDACNFQPKTKMVADGWYIDAAFQLDCDYQTYAGYTPKNQKTGCQDKYNLKQVGTVKRGYAVYEKMTMFDESGKETFSMINEVVELSNANLDAALFDAPQGWREVKSSTELYASMSRGSSSPSDLQTGAQNSSSQNLGLGSTVSQMNSQKSSNISTSVGAKKEGYVRIGVPSVKVGAVGEGLNAGDLAAAIQNTFGEYLKGTKIELVAIEAKLPSQADLEAKQKECDYVLYVNASHKKGGGGFGMFGKALGAAVAQTGGGAWGNTTANVAGAVTANTIVSATAAQNVKSKDELTLDVKLQQPGGAATLTKQFKAKAKSDGEDIISQIVEQAAAAIVGATGKS